MKKSALIVMLFACIVLVCGCTAGKTNGLVDQAIDSYRKGDTDRYRELVLQAYAENPTDPFVINNMGVLAEFEGNTLSARDYYWLAWQRAGSLTVVTTNGGGFIGRPLKDLVWANYERMMRQR